MSTAIIKDERRPSFLVYCKSDSYPAGLGFQLLDTVKSANENNLQDLLDKLFSSQRFEVVKEIPKDIQYEYVIKANSTVHCQECWYTADKGYHGGGFRHGGVYDLEEWKEKVRLQDLYAYRRPEAWQ